jgi:hypothetical protein
VFGGGVPFIATLLAGIFTGVPLVGLLYPMTIAGIGVIVSTVGVRRETKDATMWDETDALRPAASA